MFIERFFNPYVSDEAPAGRYYSTKEALEYCITYHLTYIRHWSFKSDQYIKYNGKELVWNDGSRVDRRKLPKKGNGWGKYHSELFNRSPF